MERRIFSYDDFRSFLEDELASERMGKGGRQKLAQYLGCQPSFISQVLSRKNELSLEHAHKLNQFFNHDKEASWYFMLLVQLSKAGSFELQKFFREQIEVLRKEQLQVGKVVNKAALTESDTVTYYSDWIYVAIHMLVTIDAFRQPEAIKKKLQLSDKQFSEALHFLKTSGLVVEENGLLDIGEAHIHLSKTSPVAQTASLVTRLKVLEKMRLSSPENIHFSSNFTISKKSKEIVKKAILQFIQELDVEIVKDDPESFCTITIDFVET